MCRSYVLYADDVKWPEVERGEKISYIGRRARTTIGHVDKYGLHVALLSPNLVTRLVSTRGRRLGYKCVFITFRDYKLRFACISAGITTSIAVRAW